VTGSIVARRYAKALFALGGKSGMDALDACSRDLASLTALADASQELAALFRNPVFFPDEKRRVLTALADKCGVGRTVRDFCFLLADQGRLADLPGIAGEFETLLDKEKGILRGTLTTAVPLNANKRSAVKKRLEKKAGRKLALTFAVDPGIFGGMLLTVGDMVLDASLRAQLSLLTDTIKRGA